MFLCGQRQGPARNRSNSNSSPDRIPLQLLGIQQGYCLLFNLPLVLLRPHGLKVKMALPDNMLLLLLLSCLSRVQLCAAPQVAAHQAPLSLGFSRQEHWSGVPLPSPPNSFYKPIITLISNPNKDITKKKKERERERKLKAIFTNEHSHKILNKYSSKLNPTTH